MPLDLYALAAEVAEGVRATYAAHPVDLVVAPGMITVAGPPVPG